MALTERQQTVLDAFAEHGGLLVPQDDELRDRCKELTKMKLLRPQPMLNRSMRVGDSNAISVAFQVTVAGYKLAKPTPAAAPGK